MAYKMFNKDLTCSGFQYEVGETYELPKNKKLELCKNGFHYCENPLSCLEYYSLLDKDCNINPMCKVTPLGTIETKGNKSVTDKIKIDARLSLKQFIKASCKFIKEKVKVSVIRESCSQSATSELGSKVIIRGDYSQVATSGDWSRITASGDYIKVATGGYNSKVATSGECSQIATTGGWSKVATSGDYDDIVTVGSRSQIATSGNYSKVATIGAVSQAVTIGNYSKVVTIGDCSKVATSGKNSIIANIGRNGIAKGIKGTWITLAEYKYYERKEAYIPVYVKSFKVDGKKVKANTFYKLENKKLVEVKEM